MTDEEAMEALLNSDGYSFPTWTLKLGLPTDEMRLVMSLIASDKAPIPVDVAYISEYLHMDGAVVESSVKELLDRRLVYKKDSYLILDLEMCDHIFDAAATVRQAKVNSDIDEAFCPPIPLVAMRAGEIYSDSSLVSRLVLGFISAWSFAADFSRIVRMISQSYSGCMTRMSRMRSLFGVIRVWLTVCAAHSSTKSV